MRLLFALTVFQSPLTLTLDCSCYAQAFAQEKGAPYVETSALTGHGVDQAFGVAVGEVLQRGTFADDAQLFQKPRQRRCMVC